LVEYAQSAILFNPEPQATISGHAVACGSGLNYGINNPQAASATSPQTDTPFPGNLLALRFEGCSRYSSE
jgi:hypothetical protein